MKYFGIIVAWMICVFYAAYHDQPLLAWLSTAAFGCLTSYLAAKDNPFFGSQK